MGARQRPMKVRAHEARHTQGLPAAVIKWLGMVVATRFSGLATCQSMIQHRRIRAQDVEDKHCTWHLLPLYLWSPPVPGGFAFGVLRRLPPDPLPAKLEAAAVSQLRGALAS